MVLGSQEKDGLGRAIVYQSLDLLNWDYIGPISKRRKYLQKDLCGNAQTF